MDRDIRRIKQRLASEGWAGRDSGPHTVYTHPSKPGRVVVPKGRGDLPAGTARSIANAAGWI